MQGQQDDTLSLSLWEPAKYLRHFGAHQARLSRGFLQSKPAKWVPGFAMQWVPLAHSFGIDLRIKQVEPCIQAARQAGPAFSGTVDDEPIALLIEQEAAKRLLSTLAPGASAQAQNLLLEYLARRFLSSLALSWSGPESSVVLFDSSISPTHVREAAAVKVDLLLNDNPLSVWVLLGNFLAERLDGLWRRQVRSSVKASEGPLELSLEIAQLAVEPSMLSEYTKSQAVVDLEVAMSERLVLRSKGNAWGVGNLCDVDGKLGVEITDDVIPAPRLPEGTTRMAIEFGRVKLQPSELVELSQKGAIWSSELPCSPLVNLMINDERVGMAELMVYEGRFAIKVK